MANPYSVIQAGTALKMMSSTGTLATLTLPTGVTLRTDRVPRFTVFGRYVVMVNSPTRPLSIDSDGNVRFLTLKGPSGQPTLSAGSAGALTGTYQVEQTFRVYDKDGNIISESDFGPASLTQAIAAQMLKVTELETSPDLDAISIATDRETTMLYRTVTLGTTYYPWVELDGNVQTQVQDDLADAALSLVAAPTLGPAPDLTLISEFRGRLWGVDSLDIDYLRYSEAGQMYAWPADNSLLVPRLGADSRGITGLIPRREALGVGRRNALRQVTGATNADFRVVNLTDNVGVESQESMVIYNDSAFWLWKDGVYKWDASGITCISDGVGGKGAVRSWFTTDSYFNRSYFVNAFAVLLPERHVYRLFLPSAGQTTIDRFVDFDFAEGVWYGPHKTGAFTLVSAFTRPTVNDVLVPSIGVAEQYVVQEQATRTDSSVTPTAIDLDVDSKRHDSNTPLIDKFFGQMDLFTIAQSGGFMTVTPSVGELNAPVKQQALQADLRDTAQCLGRVSDGKSGAKMAQLNFRQNTIGQDVEILGYELPFSELGHRI